MTTATTEAPNELETVRAFVNTLDIDHAGETFTSPADLVNWLVERNLLEHDDGADECDLARARAFREALRQLLLSNNDGRPVDPTALAAVDDVAARSSLRLRFSAGGGTWLDVQCKGVDGALGRLVVIVYRAMEAGTWRRLKACRSDSCQWVFFDQSRNSSRHWCSMTVCGDQHKAREYRRRRSGAPAEG